jgi:hypothetical protein
MSYKDVEAMIKAGALRYLMHDAHRSHSVYRTDEVLRRAAGGAASRARSPSSGCTPRYVAVGGKVIFMPPCLFCMDNHP